MKFGRWTVLSESPITGKWIARCRCKRVVIVDGSALRRGRTKSCGCHKGASISLARMKYPKGTVHTPEYRIWRGMINRCENKRDHDYKTWGGRGIRIASEWRHDFIAFLKYVGVRPSSDHSIDRFPNPNGNYEPGNVRWATPREQAGNRRNTRLLTVGAETLPAAEWSRRYGVPGTSIMWRVRNGWTPEAAVTIPTNKSKKRHLLLTRVSLPSAKEK